MVDISTLIISTIWLTFDLLVSSVPRPCPYMLGSSNLTQVFYMCKTILHPFITWCLNTMNCRDGAYSGRTLIPWNLVKGSSYNATAVLRKIRCIKDKQHMQWKYVTWYGHHLVLLISISKASSWSPSSPARHLDLHRCVGVDSPTIANA